MAGIARMATAATQPTGGWLSSSRCLRGVEGQDSNEQRVCAQHQHHGMTRVASKWPSRCRRLPGPPRVYFCGPSTASRRKRPRMPSVLPAASAVEGNDGDGKRPSKRSAGDRPLSCAGAGVAIVANAWPTLRGGAKQKSIREKLKRQAETGSTLAHSQPSLQEKQPGYPGFSDSKSQETWDPGSNRLPRSDLPWISGRRVEQIAEIPG